MTIDESIFTKSSNPKYFYFFYPEIKRFLDESKLNVIEKKIQEEGETIIEHFKEIRQEGENNSYISNLIRNDSIKEFIIYLNKNNISLSKTTIKKSIFETNSFLIEKQPTLIEYAAFFGSIQIFNFLRLNNVEMKSSLWLYVIHGKNPELIHQLEENKIQPPKNSYKLCFYEAIKCHHNDISCYIKDNLIEVEYRLLRHYFFGKKHAI